jgi:hypothetical protein
VTTEADSADSDEFEPLDAPQALSKAELMAAESKRAMGGTLGVRIW